MDDRAQRAHSAPLGFLLGAAVFAVLAILAMPRVLAETTSGDATPGPAALRATPSGSATVTGDILIPAMLPPGPPAPAYVRIEDVSRADAPATEIASVTIHDVFIPASGGSIPFAIPVDRWDPRASYSVRVHIDRDSDGAISRGDLVSTQMHPVLTAGNDPVTVPVSEV